MRSKKPPDSFAISLRLLSYRGRSAGELRKRLFEKGFEEFEIEKTLERLTALGFLNDRALADSLRRSAEEGRLLGKMGARRFLKDRGIKADDAENALADYDETAAAKRLYQKKTRISGPIVDAKGKRRIISALARKGFSTATIYKTLKMQQEEAND